MHKVILQRLHDGHPGQEKSLKPAQSVFYWPGMTNDIRQYVESCKACFHNLRSQPSNSLITLPPSTFYGAPMAHVGLDSFDFAGQKFLLCVDGWSGYPLYKLLRTTTTKAILSILEDWFKIFGLAINLSLIHI